MYRKNFNGQRKKGGKGVFPVLNRWWSQRNARRGRRTVRVYRIFTATSPEVVFADSGDEMLIGRYITRVLRAGGAGAVVIEPVEMTLDAARAIPRDKLLA